MYASFIFLGEAEKPRDRQQRVKNEYATRAYFKMCIFKACQVNKEDLERHGRGLGFGVVPGL